MRRRQTYLRIPGLQGFEIKGRVINDGYTDKRDRTVASYIEHETRSKRGTVRIVIEVSEIVGGLPVAFDHGPDVSTGVRSHVRLGGQREDGHLVRPSRRGLSEPGQARE